MARFNLNNWWTPANVLRALAIFVVGSLFGVGVFTFGYAKGASSLSNDPATCINCHAMESQWDGWNASSHKAVAGCNDCHAPHDNVVHKWLVKGENGFWHALKFTTGWYPENIEIRDSNLKVTNNACLYCHADYVDEIHMTRPERQQVTCTQCHSDVGHK